MHFHDHYKELHALALSGQIARAERDELEDHLSTCSECRTELADFAQVAVHFPQIADDRQPLDVPVGLTERFIARARSEGIPLSRNTKIQAVRKRSKQSRTVRFALAAAFLAGLAGTCVIAKFLVTYGGILPAWTMIFSSAPDSSRIAPQPPAPAAAVALDRMLQENAGLKERIHSIQSDLVLLSARVKSDQDALKAAEAEKRALSSRLANAEDLEAGLRRGVTDRDIQVVQIKGKLEKLQKAKETDDIVLQAEENELNNLREQTAKLNAKLQESEQLSEAANEAKDLVVARKLHIVDVDDTDENGKQQKPFGRIFYAEGKALKFYAYDLADPRKLNAKVNFYVWGSKEGATKSVKSLGIFHSDDVSDRRWVLEFKDSRVLAQIDCLFVTAESDKKPPVTHPTGKQILFASLGKSNHP